jgi:hypothetical protein
MSLTQLLAISPLGDTIYRYNKQLKEFEEWWTWWTFSSSSLCNFCSEQIGYTIYIYEDNDINEINNEYVLK